MALKIHLVKITQSAINQNQCFINLRHITVWKWKMNETTNWFKCYGFTDGKEMVERDGDGERVRDKPALLLSVPLLLIFQALISANSDTSSYSGGEISTVITLQLSRPRGCSPVVHNHITMLASHLYKATCWLHGLPSCVTVPKKKICFWQANPKT